MDNHTQAVQNLIKPAKTIYYSFPSTAQSYFGPGDLADWRPVNTEVKSAYQTIFAKIETFLDVEFEETSDPRQDVVLTISQNEQIASSGYAYFPTAGNFLGGDIFISHQYADPKIDGSASQKFDYEVLIHELGHALGLKHPHEADGNNTVRLPNSEDNSFQTAMTYEDRPAAYTETFRPFDIMALTKVFGVNDQYRAGDDTYRFDGTAPVFIIDGDGADTIDASNSNRGVTIDLRPGTHSFDGTQTALIAGPNQMTIAFDSVIERAITGDGPDTLIGNGASNYMFAGRGNDQIYAGDGADTIRAGGGDDVIDLGETTPQRDTLHFESNLLANGRDTIYGFDQGAMGDKLDIDGFSDAPFLAVVYENNVPIGVLDGCIARLTGQDLTTGAEVLMALGSTGVFSSLSLSSGASALCVTASDQETGRDQHLFWIGSENNTLTAIHLATFQGNFLDIDSWDSANFV
jgi:hypothetical protein